MSIREGDLKEKEMLLALFGGVVTLLPHLVKPLQHLNDFSCLLSKGAMAATYSALNSSKPSPQLKPIESSILAQRRVKKLPSTTL